ncbi:MAG: IS110 family transposase, partial [Methanothrix sp.]|nr:IS110 family transposase [Methanothrix sp.]
MTRFYGCDAHKNYCLFTWVDDSGESGPFFRVKNERSEFKDYLSTLPSGSPIALETVGNWYWMVEEMEKAGHLPLLTNAAKAKAMMGKINKTDKLDARGLATLLRNGTLPSVWIPPGELRDKRELSRTRMALVRMRTMIKNRVHAILSKYALHMDEISDIFGLKARHVLENKAQELPPYTRECLFKELELLDEVEQRVHQVEAEIRLIMTETEEIKLLRTIPGVGFTLAVVIATEIGDINRFPGPEKLASYAGTVPRVKASGGKVFHGPIRPDVNRYLKWAFVEAANTVVIFHKKWANKHAARLYFRLRAR